MIGSTFGEYRIAELLGSGGMGSVYRAVDLMLERDVALKILRSDVSDEPEQVERFRTEAVILARLGHPNIATLYRLAREDDRLYMAMEFVRGRTLADLLARNGRLPLVHGLSWCCQVLDAMEYAHDLGVVHRDLKPANLMITDNGTVKVTDFGIARALGTLRQTRHGYVIGTPAYMSPEQVRGREVDGRSDIYALGMVLFETLTGRLPFEARDEISLLRAHLTQQPPRPRTFLPHMPPAVDETIARAIAKAPEERFQSAAQLRIELEAALDGLVPEQEDAVPASLPPPRQRATTAPGVSRAPGAVEPIRVPKETRLAPEPGGDQSRGGVPAAPHGPPPSSARAGTTSTLTWKHVAGGVAALVTLLAAVLAVVIGRGGLAPAGGVSVDGARAARPLASSPTSEQASTGPLDRQRAAGARPAERVPPPAQQPPEPAPVSGGPVAVKPPAERTPPASSPPAAPRASPPAAPADPAPRPAGLPPDNARVPNDPSRPAPDGVPTAITFTDVKFLHIEGEQTREVDGLLTFDADGLRVLVERNQAVFKMMPYRAITSGVYSRSKQPRWKAGPGSAGIVRVFAAPLAFVKSTRHWLTIQSRDDFVVLRLDKDNYQLVIPAFETRTGLKVTIDKGDK